MKKYAASAAAIGSAFIVGILFIALDVTSYTSIGVSGGFKALNVIISLIFCLCFFMLAAFCGRKHLSGVVLGGALAFVVFVGIGFMCYFGLSVIVGNMAEIFYVFSAPFVPLTDFLTTILGLYAYADLTMLLIPAFIYLTAFAAYFIGSSMKSSPVLFMRRSTHKSETVQSEQLTA